MLRIRFFRKGRKKQPFYKIVVTDKNNPPASGRFVEDVGFYNPLTKECQIKGERVIYWMEKGAHPSDVVRNLLIKKEIIKGEKVNVVSISEKRKEKIAGKKEKEEKKETIPEETKEMKKVVEETTEKEDKPTEEKAPEETVEKEEVKKEEEEKVEEEVPEKEDKPTEEKEEVKEKKETKE